MFDQCSFCRVVLCAFLIGLSALVVIFGDFSSMFFLPRHSSLSLLSGWSTPLLVQPPVPDDDEGQMKKQVPLLEGRSTPTASRFSSGTGRDICFPEVANESAKDTISAKVAKALEPGDCALEGIKPPCDPFKLIKHDLDKFAAIKRPPRFVGGEKKLHFGVANGHVFVAYLPIFRRRSTKPSIADGQARKVAEMLYRISQQDEFFQTEFASMYNDVVGESGASPRTGGKKCKGWAMFHPIADNTRCSLTLPWGIRPGLMPLNDTISFWNKTNQVFWGGSYAPCGYRSGGYMNCGRFWAVVASNLYPDLINARFFNNGQALPKKTVCNKTKLSFDFEKMDFQNQFKYRFLITSAAPVSVTGRLQHFLASNSILLKFSTGWEKAGQASYAGLQDGVHLKLLKNERGKRGKLDWVETVKTMIADSDRFAPLSENARAYMKWLQDPRADVCYLWELLKGYTAKMPGTTSLPMCKTGKKCHTSSSSCDTYVFNTQRWFRKNKKKPWWNVSDVTVCKSGKFHIEMLPVRTSTGNIEETCKAFKQDRPRWKVFDASSGQWM